jgi:hypothetical protein
MWKTFVYNYNILNEMIFKRQYFGPNRKGITYYIIIITSYNVTATFLLLDQLYHQQTLRKHGLCFYLRID